MMTKAMMAKAIADSWFHEVERARFLVRTWGEHYITDDEGRPCIDCLPDLYSDEACPATLPSLYAYTRVA